MHALAAAYDPAKPPVLVDFFSGCGGTSAGFRESGMRIIAGIDNDQFSGMTFVKNFPEAMFLGSDIREMDRSELADVISQNHGYPLVFSACAPCQPFSKQKRGRTESDIRIPLLLELLRFVRAYLPVCIFVENVPGMQNGVAEQTPFQTFRKSIKRHGYKTTIGVVSSAAYGVPQRRMRFVAVASRLGAITFPEPTHGPGTSRRFSTVRDWIGDFPAIEAGEAHPTIANHRAGQLSPLNLQRIRSTPEGGGRKDWPAELLPTCHSNGYDGHTDVYGRMAWDSPATGLTTRCTSYSNGRFGHPEQDRAISAREAASLQTFPEDFVFSGNWNSLGCQIGNAIPVRLANAFGKCIVEHIAQGGALNK